ncbi:MAG TPA: formate dehydrogenase subunit alpha [Ottowia sp.]|uniref:formate dehydrogenase subunit alpha n=1 Tax=Ottowia sp. TaxID=1898956 RepID=UPI002CD3029B|nr:formate dehydrogenase subunit alpha [Ottowia sp.]HNE60757.1 formate dehydrogenase subunit alpha [Ottowia sp.]HNJ44536.1 formate dehydrogenase subunit alpha [Ottowia sp.]HNL41623.1 formate dehydrogenase subunit alpha [Ottowia sp.]HNN33104.1 formate dehydrogenase subunit alpha [Ottowia sp.]HNR82971.1 formate dehydrogenase subunit alpha [Ottowia sp.]
MTPALACIAFELDGQPATAFEGETILKAAERHGVQIPRLCFTDGLRADGNCRACVVEVDGERTLAPSCCRAVQPGMKVRAASERARRAQDMVLELLLAELPAAGFKWLDDDATQPHGELSQWASQRKVGVRQQLQNLQRPRPTPDLSHPAMAVNLDACIQCTRCVRACREAQVNDVIGLAGRGAEARIVFDLDDAMGASSCVACGECVQACPTGALMPKTHIGPQRVDRSVDSVCPFCGVGCQITYHVRDEKIVSVSGRNGPANAGRLCVKGRFGFDYAASPDRLTRPLIRIAGVPKDPAHCQQPPDWRTVFREASWDEALDAAAGGLRALKSRHGPRALAGFGSAKGTNEEAYLFQKLVRTGFGSNNVDHCTRLCHASSVAALLEGVGSGAVSNPVRDVEHAELILVIGANPTANHPVAASWMKNAARRGTRIVLADPRATDIARHCWRVLQFRPGSDVALLNALLHVIVTEGLGNESFLRQRADHFAALAANVQGYSPEAMAPICGIPAETLREVARAYATARSAMILWGMGVSQHVHGTDNARCLIALATCTGQLGRPGTGLHPLRGQNNVQGASDAGLIPMMYPNYQRVDSPDARTWFEDFWGQPLDPEPGYTVVEIMRQALAADDDPHKVRGMYIMGENPAMSDPDLNHTRHALASLSHLVVQDIFLTETAWLADVVLPASAWPEKTGSVSNTDRMVQLGRQALAPPGEARADLWIIQQLAQRLGLPWNYENDSCSRLPDKRQGPFFLEEPHGVAAVYEEMRRAMHGAIAGIGWDRLVRESSVTYPCLSEDDPGQPIVFTERVPTPNGRVQLVPADIIAPDERPDADYPMVLITGRQLEHWHTGAMTRRAVVLDALEPAPTVSMHGDDLARLGLVAGELVRVSSRRGRVCLTARRDDGTPVGGVFIPFAFREAAANLLTNAALDPFGKIPEFKYCAVRVEPLA